MKGFYPDGEGARATPCRVTASHDESTTQRHWLLLGPCLRRCLHRRTAMTAMMAYPGSLRHTTHAASLGS